MSEIITRVKRRYFEVFGDLEKEISFLRRTNLFLVFAVILVFIGAMILGMKPPVVIRVSEVEGAQVIRDLNTNNAPTSYEVISLAKRFTVRYTAFNSFTVTKDLAEAFNLMSIRLQQESKKSLIDSGLVQKLKDAQIDTQTEFKEAKIERDSQEASTVSLIGIRRISKYDDPSFHEEILFRADIVLKKVARSSSAPEGLLIEAYREMILNDLSRKEEKKS